MPLFGDDGAEDTGVGMTHSGLVPFVRLFPQQATAETRVLIVRGHSILPDDDYGLLESYCAEAGCNCQRVRLNVIARRSMTGQYTCSPICAI
jgi:hypothetical protein